MNGSPQFDNFSKGRKNAKDHCQYEPPMEAHTDRLEIVMDYFIKKDLGFLIQEYSQGRKDNVLHND